MGAYCSFIKGHCEFGKDWDACAKQSTVSCRNRRDQNERILQELEDKHAGVRSEDE